MSQSMTNICVRCETKFMDWSLYHGHVQAKQCNLMIKPWRTSNRSIKQIVIDWEANQPKGAIIS